MYVFVGLCIIKQKLLKYSKGFFQIILVNYGAFFKGLWIRKFVKVEWADFQREEEKEEEEEHHGRIRTPTGTTGRNGRRDQRRHGQRTVRFGRLQ